MTLSCKDDGSLKMPAKDSDSESFDDSDKSGSEDGDEDLVRERCQFQRSQGFASMVCPVYTP